MIHPKHIHRTNQVEILIGALAQWRHRPDTPTRTAMIRRFLSVMTTLMDQEDRSIPCRWTHDMKWFSEHGHEVQLDVYDRIETHLTDDDIRHLDKVGVLMIDHNAMSNSLCWSRCMQRSALIDESRLPPPSGDVADLATAILDYVENN